MYTVAVRELCEFTAKRGDLDRRFTPSPTAEEGIEGHAIVAARRGAAHARELWLKSTHGQLTVRGRADGYDASRNRLEEVKTHKGCLERQPAVHRHLHWAQAKVYGWLVCERDSLQALDVVLVYFDIGSQQETEFVEHCSALQLHRHFLEQCDRFMAWAEQEALHRHRRDIALNSLVFAFPAFRQGQRQLSEAVYNASRSGRCLLVEAPTGSGKTLGTLFPMLKAMPRHFDKVVYLTAKSSGRALALDALQRLHVQGVASPLRALELVARQKACEHPDLACHGESCPLARGFYDRLPGARQAALAECGLTMPMNREFIRRHALAHQVCPYYLSQELARWADVVIGDYNYWFDSRALLYGLQTANDWRVGLLVDEAHNLIERARDMYSAELNENLLKRAWRSPTVQAAPSLKRVPARVRRRWSETVEEAMEPYQALKHVPAKLLDALQRFNAEITSHQAETPVAVDALLTDLFFASQKFCSLASSLDTHSFIDLSRTDANGPTLAIRNVVPACFVRRRIQCAHSSVLFSATLQPFGFYADMLGLPESHVQVDVESPFHASQLDVCIASHISTRYLDRTASAHPIAELLAQTYQARPGNYLAYFSSYVYLAQVANALVERMPGVACWQQTSGMNEKEQRAFIDGFTEQSRGIGFAVLGGAFAEGVDLPGARLVGVFVATLGLPPADGVREEMRRRIEALLGSGYEYTYLYPGMRKVVQAAGRVIRSQTDRGTVMLIDDRFNRPETRRLLPRWWEVASGRVMPAIPIGATPHNSSALIDH